MKRTVLLCQDVYKRQTLDLATVSNLPFHCLCISNALFSIVILISEQLVAKRRRESQILVGMFFYALS